MKRTPFYHKQSHLYRVIYRPNQLWVAQMLTGDKATREHDPWQDLHGPCEDRDKAIEVMYTRLPMRRT